MPVPGPRNQTRPLPGYTNPWGQEPSRINRWDRPEPVVAIGRSPGTMVVTRRGSVLAAGTIRRLWRQSVNLVAAQAGYSWTSSAPAPGAPVIIPPALGVTAALRYMTRSVYAAAGTDNTRMSALHTRVRPHVRSKPVSTQAGNVRSRPTVRNRLSSFGSRIPPINAKLPAGQ